MSDKDLVDNMERIWSSLSALCDSLSQDDWKLPTACPGWSVQDQLSHLAGNESRILGRALPDHTPNQSDHVKNETGSRNEISVDWRRSWSGQQVLQEFREVTTERMQALRALMEEDFTKETDTPAGVNTVRELLGRRIFDAWVHEQDIRRAVSRPGNLEGPVADHAMNRLAMAMPYVVGRKAQAPDGSTVVFEVTGPAGRTLPVAVEGQRAKYLDEVPNSPTVRLTMDMETFSSVGCGRIPLDEVQADNRVQIEGDQHLGQKVLEQMNIMV